MKTPAQRQCEEKVPSFPQKLVTQLTQPSPCPCSTGFCGQGAEQRCKVHDTLQLAPATLPRIRESSREFSCPVFAKPNPFTLSKMAGKLDKENNNLIVSLQIKLLEIWKNDGPSDSTNATIYVLFAKIEMLENQNKFMS